MKTTKRNLSLEKLEHLSKILKIISHPVKLEILEILESEGPLDVSTICLKIGVGCEISMMSHHLSKMKDNGILKSEKKGKYALYSIENWEVLRIFDCFEKLKF